MVGYAFEALPVKPSRSKAGFAVYTASATLGPENWPWWSGCMVPASKTPRILMIAERVWWSMQMKLYRCKADVRRQMRAKLRLGKKPAV